MRIIHTADWHIGKLLCDYSLLNDQRYYFNCFISDMKQLKPDAIIVAGDIYDRSIPSTDAVDLLSDILSKLVLELKIPTIIVAGNHDSRERLSFANDLLKNNQLFIEGNLHIDIKKITIGNANFYALPYYEPYDARSIFNEKQIKTIDDATAAFCETALSNIDTTKLNILISHGFFVYSDYNLHTEDTEVGGSNIASAKLFDQFDYVALGHIHSNKAIGKEKMRYSGSPLKYSIDEANHIKSYTVIEFDEQKNFSISYHSIKPLHDVRIIESSFDKLITSPSNMSSEDYVHINLTDDNYILGAISTLKTLFPNILGISYPNINYSTTLPTLLNNIKSNDNNMLFADFFELVNNCEISSEQKLIVAEIFNDIRKG